MAGKLRMVSFGRILIPGRLKMKTKVRNRNIFAFMAIVVFFLIASPVVYPHCQVPCGIYDDNIRFKMIAEHITTIAKSMNKIIQISGEKKPDMNQLVRWVQNKEIHADELSNIITYYFMAQRIKPTEKTDAKEYKNYLTKLTLLHQMLAASMKAKQTTDLSIPKQLTELSESFKKAYYEKQ